MILTKIIPNRSIIFSLRNGISKQIIEQTYKYKRKCYPYEQQQEFNSRQLDGGYHAVVYSLVFPDIQPLPQNPHFYQVLLEKAQHQRKKASFQSSEYKQLLELGSYFQYFDKETLAKYGYCKAIPGVYLWRSLLNKDSTKLLDKGFLIGPLGLITETPKLVEYKINFDRMCFKAKSNRFYVQHQKPISTQLTYSPFNTEQWLQVFPTSLS